MRANRIRELWAAGKPALNCWITLPGTLAAEMLAHQGWDSLTVDLQHGGSDFASMCAMFAAISTTDTVPLMRVAWNAPGDVMRDRRFGDSERLEILRAWAAEGDPGLAQQIGEALGDMERRLAVSGHAAE